MREHGGTTPHRGTPSRSDEELAAPRGLRRSPSGRVPQWVIGEALEQQRQDRLRPGGRRREQRRTDRVARRTARRWARAHRRRGRARRAAPAVGVALLIVLWFAPGLVDRYALPAVRPYLPDASAPPPGVEAARAPLGVPPAVADAGGYRFMDSPDPDQQMVAYDPCRPVHWVVRPDGAPPGGQQLIEEAVAEISAATGLQFVHGGTTTEGPSLRREPYQPDHYGRQWAPVLITWSDATEHPDLAGDVAGLGGSTARQAHGQPLVYVTGQVTLDTPALTSMMQRPESVRAVILHELAHVVGLDHVDDPEQLLHGDNVGVTGLADGDRAGLAELGAGPCVPQV